MKYDFSTIEDVESYASVPEGTYVCRIAEVREGRSRSGDPRWSFRLVVAEGEHAGHTAAWDGLNWSPRGVARVQAVLAALGFDTRGVLDIQPADLVGRVAEVTLLLEDWEDPRTGRRQVRLRVPYRGYEPLGGAGEEALAEDARG